MKLTLIALSICMPLWAGESDDPKTKSKTAPAKENIGNKEDGMFDVPLGNDENNMTPRIEKEPLQKKKVEAKECCVIQ